VKRCQCEAIGCRAAIQPTEVFCRKHFVMLESDTQRALGRTFKPDAKRHSATFLVILEGAQREILFYVTNGHRLPRDRQFEWDDPPEVL
jgi:hypothetical protein